MVFPTSLLLDGKFLLSSFFQLSPIVQSSSLIHRSYETNWSKGEIFERDSSLKPFFILRPKIPIRLLEPWLYMSPWLEESTTFDRILSDGCSGGNTGSGKDSRVAGFHFSSSVSIPFSRSIEHQIDPVLNPLFRSSVCLVSALYFISGFEAVSSFLSLTS